MAGSDDARPSIVLCPFCGRANRSTRELCAVCGRPLYLAARPGPAPPAAPRARATYPTQTARSSGGYPSRGGDDDDEFAPGPRSRSSSYRRPPTSSPRYRGRPVRRKIWVLVVFGAILLGIAALFGIPALLESSQTSSATVAVDTSWTLHSTALTAESAQIKWHGGVTTTHTYLVGGGATPSCTSPTGVVTSGGGKGGSFTAQLQPGKTYQLFACSGTGGSATSEALAFSVDVSAGVTKGDVVAIVLTVFGLPMLLLGLRGRYRHPEDDDE